MPGDKAGKSTRLPSGLGSSSAATGIPASTIDAGNSPYAQASAAPAASQHRRTSRTNKSALPDTADPIELSTNAIARLLSTDMREDLLTILREIFERNTLAERLAYSPDEAAELLGVSRELVHDLLRTGQLGSVKAGRRRLIAKQHLKAFLAGEE